MEILPKPEWLVIKTTSEYELNRIQSRLARYNLNSVCQAAQCPNLFECWREGKVTIMILGSTCTRACRFCATSSGNPGGKVDQDEAARVAEFASALGLDYLVITSVTRDDLKDGGASVFAQVVHEIKSKRRDLKVEVLVPDFQGSIEALQTVLKAGPEVLAHNLETVERLSGRVRDAKASYRTSLLVLETAKSLDPRILVKSGLTLGLGETENEVIQTMTDLRDRGVDILTLGQYLTPAERCLPVTRYITPQEFEYLQRKGYEMGFNAVFAGPLVRSSYKASLLAQTALGADSKIKGDFKCY